MKRGLKFGRVALERVLKPFLVISSTAFRRSSIKFRPKPVRQTWLLHCCLMMLISAASPATAQQVANAAIGSRKQQVDTLVLCPLDFQPALAKWLTYRRQQGYQIRIESPAPIAAGIKQQIQAVADLNPLQHVVLVGDSGDQWVRYQQLLATDYVPAQVNVLFGSEREIATDNSYADLDFDGLPELTIGRIPADSATQLIEFLDRVIAYETHANRNLRDSLWQRRINLIAGVGGLGRVVDAVVEQTAKQMITDLVPAAYQTSMTYGSWSSPYCPDPRRFSETAIKRFNEGCLFWVYVGHGDRRRLDYVRLPDQWHPILDTNRVTQLDCETGNPIAICLACYSGATDSNQDGLAESMLMQPGGPIAVICGTRVTMPYAMSRLSLEMMEEFFEGDAATLGQLVRVSMRRMANEKAAEVGDDEYRRLIEEMGKSLSPFPRLLPLERLEHAKLIHLLGDPLLKLPRPQAIELDVVSEVAAGESLEVQGSSPTKGQLQLELVYERDRFLKRPKRRRKYESSDLAFREYQQVYEGAQQRTVAKFTVPIEQGSFEQVIEVPATASGRCQVRATVVSKDVFAMGSAAVRVARPTAVREARKR